MAKCCIVDLVFHWLLNLYMWRSFYIARLLYVWFFRWSRCCCCCCCHSVAVLLFLFLFSHLVICLFGVFHFKTATSPLQLCKMLTYKNNKARKTIGGLDRKPYTIPYIVVVLCVFLIAVARLVLFAAFHIGLLQMNRAHFWINISI